MCKWFLLFMCGEVCSNDYAHFLQTFLNEHPIQTVLDINGASWEEVDWTGIEYIRCDSLYDLPEADLLLCKNVLPFLSNDAISNDFIPQLSKFKYCLITNKVYPGSLTSDNADGISRTLDLSMRPFRLPMKKVFHYVVEGAIYQVALLAEP